jgi:hypothetical protein
MVNWRPLMPVFLLTHLATGQVIDVRVQPEVAGRPVREGQVTVVALAPRYVTSIRLPEAINSVVVGDPASFAVEHSDREPNLVFVKPTTSKAAETNLLVTTARGTQVSLLLVSKGEPQPGSPTAVDFLMRYRPPGQFLIQPSEYPSFVIPRTASLGDAVVESPAQPSPAAQANGKSPQAVIEALLERQRRAPLPEMHGANPGLASAGKEPLKAGVSEVIDHGTEVVVLFSAVNEQDHAVLLMPPQVQLGGKRSQGFPIRRSRWVTAEQLPVLTFRLSRRRLGPGERADGVVVFQRPSFKQSNEALLLQLAESGAVDRPALAPIGFGISSSQEEVNRAAK